MHRILALGAVCSVAVAALVGVAAADEAAPISTPLHLDKAFRMPLSNGCRYDVAVRGDIVPAERPGGRRGAGAAVPDLIVNADLQCPNEATLRLTQAVANTGPLTSDALEQTIENAARLTAPVGQPPCVYTPDFNLSNAGLVLRAVAFSCPMP